MSRKSRERTGGTDGRLYRAVFYLRLSDKDRDTDNGFSNSIENQKKFLLDFISDKRELCLTSVYLDDGKSGSNFNRMGFRQMIEDIKSGKINCVIVKDLSRLGRNIYETGALLEMVFPFYNVRFIAVTDNFDSENAGIMDLSFNIPITNFVNDTYVKDMSVRIRTARRSMAQRGKIPLGSVPFGYKKTEIEQRRLEPDEEAAEIVRYIFNMFEAGKSKAGIARALNEKGIPSPARYKQMKGIKTPYRDGSRWEGEMISRILENPVYAGTTAFGRTKPANPRGKSIKAPPSEWVVKENTHKAIISSQQFKRVGLLLEAKANGRRVQEGFSRLPFTENALEGLLYCSDCKRLLKRERVKKRAGGIYYFECRNYLNGGGCSKKYINESKLKEALLLCIMRHSEAVHGGCEWQTIRGAGHRREKGVFSLPERQKAKKPVNLSRLYKDYKSGALDRSSFILMKESGLHGSGDNDGGEEDIGGEKWYACLYQDGGNETYWDIIKPLVAGIEVCGLNHIKIVLRYQDIAEKGLCRAYQPPNGET